MTDDLSLQYLFIFGLSPFIIDIIAAAIAPLIFHRCIFVSTSRLNSVAVIRDYDIIVYSDKLRLLHHFRACSSAISIINIIVDLLSTLVCFILDIIQDMTYIINIKDDYNDVFKISY